MCQKSNSFLYEQLWCICASTTGFQFNLEFQITLKSSTIFLRSVTFSGEYTKALDLLRQADIHVLPSKLPPRSDMCDWALFDKHECSRYERQFCLDEWWILACFHIQFHYYISVLHRVVNPRVRTFDGSALKWEFCMHTLELKGHIFPLDFILDLILGKQSFRTWK